MRKILHLITFCLFYAALMGQSSPLPPRPAVYTSMAPFYHGVASGDPLSDRVIIWTRVTTSIDSVVNVNWQMANDTGFASVVTSGSVTTDSSMDYCVKIDVTGLQPNTWYYYRFNTGNKYSIIGRTRTMPVGNVDSLRFAFMACSDFEAGFFNVYHDVASRNDIDAVIHLGDYYYEYKAGGSGYNNDTSRLHPFNHDALTLADYRMWQSQYKLDPDARDLFQEYPWIQIWDDHDVANNSWHTGAENHNPATQGSWFDRKAAAFKAYFEWMPIREQSPDNDSIIYRSFKWGNLVNLIMIDTRLEGRDSSLGSGIPVGNAYMNDTARRMISSTQLDWFKTQLSDTTAQWKVVGSQVLIAPLVGLGLVFNGDQWDGYPAERKRVYNHIMQNNIKDVVFVSGDIHCSWANDLPHPDSTYNPSTGAGSVAVEFNGSSVTSSAANLNALQPLLQSADPHVKYAEFTKRGYLLLDINKQRTQGDYMHVSNIATRTYTTTNDAHWMDLDGNRFLTQTSTALGPRTNTAGLVPFVTGINDVTAENNLVVFSCYPNPAVNTVLMQYYLHNPEKVQVSVTDLQGRTIYINISAGNQTGMNVVELNVADMPAGIYLLTLAAGSSVYSKQLIKR